MHPNAMELVIRQHIADLHREAAIERRASRSRKPKGRRRKSASGRLQRAPAH